MESSQLQSNKKSQHTVQTLQTTDEPHLMVLTELWSCNVWFCFYKAKKLQNGF